MRLRGKLRYQVAKITEHKGTPAFFVLFHFLWRVETKLELLNIGQDKLNDPEICLFVHVDTFHEVLSYDQMSVQNCNYYEIMRNKDVQITYQVPTTVATGAHR